MRVNMKVKRKEDRDIDVGAVEEEDLLEKIANYIDMYFVERIELSDYDGDED